MGRWAPTPQPVETSYFSAQPQGWLGADSAASVVLNDTHLLWLWGDSLLGTLSNTSRNITDFVHGTIAVQERRKGARPQFYIRSLAGSMPPTPDPNGFFQPSHDSRVHNGTYYWMVNGAALGGEQEQQPLLLLAQTVSPTGFLDQIGTDAVILFPRADLHPTHWPYRTSRIPMTTHSISFNTGVLVESAGGDGGNGAERSSRAEAHVYLLGGRAPRGPITHQLLARIPREALLGGFRWDQMRFWGGQKRGWVADVSEAATVFNGSYSEGSLGRFHGPGARYYFVGLQAFESAVTLFTAPRLTGPWTPEPLYSLPRLPPNVIAYAAKSHPALEEAFDPGGGGKHADVAASLLITFNTNLFSTASGQLPLAPDVYSPRFVSTALACKDAERPGYPALGSQRCSGQGARVPPRRVAAYAIEGAVAALAVAILVWHHVSGRRRRQAKRLVEQQLRQGQEQGDGELEDR